MFLRRNTKITYLLNCLSQCTKSASVLASSNRRNVKEFKKEDLVAIALENIEVRQPQDWSKVQDFLLNHESNDYLNPYRSANIDGRVMATLAKSNSLNLARSYLKYLETTNTQPNLATMARYLTILHGSCQEKKSKAIEQEIISICERMQKENPILDPNTLECIILALCVTKNWKKSIEICKEIKKTTSITTPTYAVLSSTAFHHNEHEFAWELLHEALSIGKGILSTPFLSYLKTLKRQRKKENIIKNLEKLFNFFQEENIKCQEDVVDDIINSFKLGSKTTVKFSGDCENCHAKLSEFELSSEEFENLKEAVFKNIIVGKDIFTKTDPQELQKFQDFIKQNKSYDVILDGLNIAYSFRGYKGPQEFSKTIATVISHFVQQNKSVLMLGRVHMQKWPRDNWNYIKQNSDIFLTQNISQDDPYLLYCALQSGKNTIIVTRDLMRNHKFLLKDRKYKILFDRWLAQRQHFVLNINTRGRVFFRTPPKFCVIPQKNGNIWHVPYIPETGHETINESYHKTWLCLNCN